MDGMTSIAAAVLAGGMTIELASESALPEKPVAAHLAADSSGSTSFRFVSDRKIDENKYPPDSAASFGRLPREQPQRDRDLGQTFLVAAPAEIRRLWLKLGSSETAVLPGAPRARVFVQWYKVLGEPRLNTNGTPGFLGVFDRAKAPELDDFLEGEEMRLLRTDYGVLPDGLAAGAVLEFRFSPLRLGPGSHAFLVGFVQAGSQRSMTLANQYYGGYRPNSQNAYAGHGIRREGLPAFGADRMKQPPGTLGFPDVCTFRDLWFCVSG